MIGHYINDVVVKELTSCRLNSFLTNVIVLTVSCRLLNKFYLLTYLLTLESTGWCSGVVISWCSKGQWTVCKYSKNLVIFNFLTR